MVYRVLTIRFAELSVTLNPFKRADKEKKKKRKKEIEKKCCNREKGLYLSKNKG